MKLEDQVILINQAFVLKALGVVQKSLFYHHPAFDRPVFGETITTEYGKQYKKTQVCNDKKVSASAYTVAELGLLLPSGFDTMRTTNEGWRAYGYDGEDFLGESVYGTEAQCRAEIIIKLISEGKLTTEEANQRLIPK